MMRRRGKRGERKRKWTHKTEEEGRRIKKTKWRNMQGDQRRRSKDEKNKMEKMKKK